MEREKQRSMEATHSRTCCGVKNQEHGELGVPYGHSEHDPTGTTALR